MRSHGSRSAARTFPRWKSRFARTSSPGAVEKNGTQFDRLSRQRRIESSAACRYARHGRDHLAPPRHFFGDPDERMADGERPPQLPEESAGKADGLVTIQVVEERCPRRQPLQEQRPTVGIGVQEADCTAFRITRASPSCRVSRSAKLTCRTLWVPSSRSAGAVNATQPPTKASPTRSDHCTASSSTRPGNASSQARPASPCPSRFVRTTASGTASFKAALRLGVETTNIHAAPWGGGIFGPVGHSITEGWSRLRDRCGRFLPCS